jgi:hypothetical protein
MLQQHITAIIQGSPALRHKDLESIATHGRRGNWLGANLQHREE